MNLNLDQHLHLQGDLDPPLHWQSKLGLRLWIEYGTCTPNLAQILNDLKRDLHLNANLLLDLGGELNLSMHLDVGAGSEI